MSLLAGVSLVAGGLSTALALGGCIGTLALREPLARVHAASIVSAVAPLLLLLGIALHEGISASAAKAAVALLVPTMGSAALAHVSAAAARRWRDQRKA